MTSAGPAITPPHEASDFENVAIRRSTWSSTPNSSHALGVLGDHHPGAVAVADLGDLGQGRHVPLHGEHTVDHDQHAAAVGGRLLERVFQAIHAVVAERTQLGARENAAVEDRGVIARVDDDRVAGGEDRPERAEVGLMPGREDQRALGAQPVGELLLELEMQVGRAVQEARAGQAGAVAVQCLERALSDALVPGQPGAVFVQRVERALLDALVTGEPEVVVGAEHDPGLALHLDDGQRGAFQHAEIRDQVELSRGSQLLESLMLAGLGEDID